MLGPEDKVMPKSGHQLPWRLQVLEKGSGCSIPQPEETLTEMGMWTEEGLTGHVEDCVDVLHSYL